MNSETLVQRYMDAWNRHDTHGVLSLMHDGAAYFDGFWRETCVGRDLAQYFLDAFESDTYSYQQVGDLIEIDDGVIFRYNAYERADATGCDIIFNGAEVLSIREGKILTVSNYYCNPEQTALIDLAALAASRHGESSYANLGLGAIKHSRIKRQLSGMIDRDEIDIDRMPTASHLADQLDCSVEHLFQVMGVTNENEFDNYIAQHAAK